MTYSHISLLLAAAVVASAVGRTVVQLQSRATTCSPLVSAPEQVSFVYPPNTRANWAPDVYDLTSYDSFPGVVLRPTNQMNPAGPYWTLADASAQSGVESTYSIASNEDPSICISNDGTDGGALFSAPCSDNPVWLIKCNSCPGDGEGNSCTFQSIHHTGNQVRQCATEVNEAIVLKPCTFDTADPSQYFSF